MGKEGTCLESHTTMETGCWIDPNQSPAFKQKENCIAANSHACRSKIVISHIHTNFSCLADNRLVSVTKHLPNSLTMLEIGWKSFRNQWLCFEVVGNLSTSLVIFVSRREIFDNLQMSSEIFGDLQNFSKVFSSLRKLSVNLYKFSFCGDEKSHAFY